jgi:hypothetical protein
MWKHTKQIFLVSLLMLASVFPLFQSQINAKTEQHSLSLKVIASEPVAMLWTLSAISGDPNKSHYLAECFKRLRPSNNSDQVLVSRFKNLIQKSQESHISFMCYGKELDLLQKLLTEAAKTPDLKSFLASCQTFLPEKDLTELKSIVEGFDPVYRETFWRRFQDRLKEQRELFEVSAAKTDMMGKLKQAEIFYDSHWPSSVPFIVALVPLPPRPYRPPEKYANYDAEFQKLMTSFDKTKESISLHDFGESLGFMQVIEAWPNDKFDQSSDVVFHEFCHSLWHNKSTAVQHCIDSTLRGPDLSATKNLLNESLATTLQAWFRKQIGADETDDSKPLTWYQDRHIDGLAKAIYANLNDYTKSARRIDSAFLERTAKAFDNIFPEESTNPRLIMASSLVLASDSKATRDLDEMLHKTVLNTSFQASSPLTSSISLKHFCNNPSECAIFLIRASDLAQLKHYKLPAELLKRLQKMTLSGKKTFLARNSKRWFVFVVDDNPAEQQRILLDIAKQKVLHQEFIW